MVNNLMILVNNGPQSKATVYSVTHGPIPHICIYRYIEKEREVESRPVIRFCNTLADISCYNVVTSGGIRSIDVPLLLPNCSYTDGCNSRRLFTSKTSTT